MESKRVVVTGLGAITPIGNTAKDFWNGLVNGANGAAEITRFDSALYKTHFACEVKGYNPDDFFDKKTVRKYDLFAQFDIVAADEAIADSGITPENTDFDDVGVMLTSGIGGVNHFFNEMKEFFQNGDGTPRFSPFLITKMIVNMPSGVISIKYGFCGPNYATVSACASSAHAIIDAFNYVRYGKSKVVVAGGAGAAIGECGIGGFNSMHALSTRNDDFMTASRPFDLNRDGFVMGEGAGSIVLEEYEHAVARGAKIYAEIVGGGASADAYHITAPDPSADGAVRAIEIALADAGVEDRSTVDYINAHGTSTHLNDAMETTAFKRVFGDDGAKKISISSTKSMHGHLLGATGALEAAITSLAVKEGFVPPTINYDNPDPELDLDYTPNTGRAREIRVALSSSLGFGGHNGILVFKKV